MGVGREGLGGPSPLTHEVDRLSCRARSCNRHKDDLRVFGLPVTLRRRTMLIYGWRTLVCWVLLALGMLAAAGPAPALEVTPVGPKEERIDITPHTERYAGRGDRLQIETAPGPDGVAGRVEVKAQTTGTNPGWMVLALRNTSDKPIERWLVAERFTFIGSGIIFPDLDASRIAAVTPSQGFVPERVASDRADIFQVSIEPGQTVTLVAEMATERFPRVTLWKPFVYETKQRERTLLNGILLGITGLLAIFLTALFAANHKIIFPATGALAWSILALLCVDFGFWHRIFRLTAEDNAIYRAAAESAVAAGLVVFLFVFLKITRWHNWIRLVWVVWILAQLALIPMAVLDPGLAATIARCSFLAIAGIGSLFIVYLVLANQDRALALMPSWLLLMVWVFAAAVAASGRLTGEFVAAGLISGLVLVLLLMSLAVTQFAFRSVEHSALGAHDSAQTRSFAVEGAGAATWEYSSRRSEVQTGSMVEEALGLQPGELSCKLDDWLKHLRLGDRERLRSQIEALLQKGSGQIQSEFQMRSGDGTFRWFALRATALPQTDQRNLRSVGLVREITREKRAHERLVLDAVRDNLTGLPSRQLFLDRLNVNFQRSRQLGGSIKAAMLLIEIDGFDKLVEEFGPIRADSMLLTMAKRLTRNLGPNDTLARMGTQQFAILLADGADQRELTSFAELLRRSIRNPMQLSGREVVLTASLGIATLSDEQSDPAQLVRDADLALFRAKKSGIDHVETFRASMRLDGDDRAADAAQLRKAMERKQILVLYQPIYQLNPERLAGFEAVLRWEHPQLGPLSPLEFMPIAEQGGFAVPLAMQVIEQAVKDAVAWQKAVPRDAEPLFVNVAVGGTTPLQPDLIQEVRTLLGRHSLPKACLRLEVSDAAVTENPERATEVLDWLRNAGAGIVLGEFGAGRFPLGYLPGLALDAIKLDRWLCFEALADGAGAGLVRGLSALARELGRPVIADAVESPADVAALRAAGCTLGLGPFYGDPLSERQMTDLLTAVRKAERKGERRGLLGGGLLTRSKKPAVRAPSSATESRAAEAAKAGARRLAAAAPAPVPASHGNGYAMRQEDAAADYGDALSATELANAYAAAAVYQDPAPPSAGLAGQDQADLERPQPLAAAMPATLQLPLQAPTPLPPRGEPVVRSDTPTVIAAAASLAPPPELLGGLARLQRGQFGARFTQAPAVSNPAVANTETGRTQELPLPPKPASWNDTLPDPEVLRGLAERLQAALRRDGN